MRREAAIVKNGSFTLEEIGQLLTLLKENDITEFSLDRGSEKIHLKRGGENLANNLEELTNTRDAPYQQAALHLVGGRVAADKVVKYSPESYDQRHENREVPQGARQEVNQGEFVGAKVTSTKLKDIRSPMVGTFFSKPSPDASPFVTVGDRVTKGQVLCIIEAMKVMNEVESEISGTLSEILLSDGQVVEFEEVIFRIDPSS